MKNSIQPIVKLIKKETDICRVKSKKVKKEGAGFGYRNWSYVWNTIGEGYTIMNDGKTFSIYMENIFDEDIRVKKLTEIENCLLKNDYILTETNRLRTILTFSFKDIEL